jgi:dTDP-4-dehydrorhamnose reductase
LASEAVKLADLTCTVEPIPSSGWPQKAERPKYSVLDMGKFIALTGHTPRPWEQGLREYVFQELGLPNHRDD